MSSKIIKKVHLIKDKDKFLEPIKVEKLAPGVKVFFYKKKYPFKLKHTNVVVVIPKKVVKKAVDRNKLRRLIKQYFWEKYKDHSDIVIVVKVYNIIKNDLFQRGNIKEI